MFKQGDNKSRENSSGINLQITLKLIPKVIRINSMATTSEQHRIKSGRSGKNVVGLVRELMEKSLEYNRLAFVALSN